MVPSPFHKHLLLPEDTTQKGEGPACCRLRLCNGSASFSELLFFQHIASGDNEILLLQCPLTVLCTVCFTVHFFTYDHEFITQYCQVSALLELESLLSQQSLREAFSDSELTTAKQRHQQVQDYIQVCCSGRDLG